jgi:protein-tyrosine phosphatase
VKNYKFSSRQQGISMDSAYVKIKNLPLLIDTLVIPGVKGQIGITSCPGLKDECSCFDHYGDSMTDDLLTIRNWGATTLVTLLEESELLALGVNDLPRKAIALNLLWIHLPIRNLSIPDEKFDIQWAWAGPRLAQWLREGQRIVIHCKEGIGRAGLIAARLMIELGTLPGNAIKTVQKARPGSLQLYSHEKYCYSLAFDRKVASPVGSPQNGTIKTW